MHTRSRHKESPPAVEREQLSDSDPTQDLTMDSIPVNKQDITSPQLQRKSHRERRPAASIAEQRNILQEIQRQNMSKTMNMDTNITQAGTTTQDATKEEITNSGENLSEHTATTDAKTTITQDRTLPEEQMTQSNYATRPKRSRKQNIRYDPENTQEQILRNIKRNKAFTVVNTYGYTGTLETFLPKVQTVYVPTTYQEAKTCNDSKLWIQSAQAEYDALLSYNTWIQRPRAPKTPHQPL